MSRDLWLYVLGVVCLSLTGFLSPFWFLGFLPLGVGLIWAAYSTEEVASAQASAASQR